MQIKIFSMVEETRLSMADDKSIFYGREKIPWCIKKLSLIPDHLTPGQVNQVGFLVTKQVHEYLNLSRNEFYPILMRSCTLKTGQ